MSDKVVYYMPRTEFGRNMLLTIPKKVKAWLQNLSLMGEESTTGRTGNLEWKFHNDQLHVSHILIDGAEPVELFWEGTFSNMYTPRGTEQWLCDIEGNLDKFVALEQRIYDELELLQRELDQRNLQALQTS